MPLKNKKNINLVEVRGSRMGGPRAWAYKIRYAGHLAKARTIGPLFFGPFFLFFFNFQSYYLVLGFY